MLETAKRLWPDAEWHYFEDGDVFGWYDDTSIQVLFGKIYFYPQMCSVCIVQDGDTFAVVVLVPDESGELKEILGTKEYTTLETVINAAQTVLIEYWSK